MMFEEEMNEFTRNFIFSTEKQLDLASCFLSSTKIASVLSTAPLKSL